MSQPALFLVMQPSWAAFFMPCERRRRRIRKLKKYSPTRFKTSDSIYDKALADYAVSFIEALSHTKGTWAGKPFELIDWQERIIRDIFGTIKPNGYRQFNTAYSISRCRRIEEGLKLKLDEEYQKDGGQSLVELLEYSADDESLNRPAPSGIDFAPGSNIRNGMASLRSAVKKYFEFCKSYR